ncbi:AfsR/SARP family transcriptional regulator [Micromonospora eburnea]|nr:AfsR/SARP family transcriptional regulator [Micromonospora eburnea]
MRSGNSSIYLSGERSRRLLAGLVIDANRTVSIARLIDIVWGDNPPATARQQIQNRLGRLRSLLTCDGSGQQIVRHGDCYTLEVTEERVDGLRFRRLCAEAGIARQHGEMTRAATLLRQGLMLWRGNAMQDVHSTMLQADAAHWEESRLRAIEMLVEIEFERGNSVGSVPELQSWAALHPYHEGLHMRLAEALHHACRTAESLAVIRDLRSRLDGELGIPPGPAVHELERRIIADQRTASPRPPSIQMNRQTAEALHRALTETTKVLQLLGRALE